MSEIKKKKPRYEKPQIKQVSLNSEILLAGNCKINSIGTGKAANRTCRNPSPANCSNNTLGS